MAGQDLGEDLERLPGVLAATVFRDGGSKPLIYLATAPNADAEMLRTAIRALLGDRGISIESDRIHIAAPPRPTAESSPLPPLALDAVEVHRTEGRVECSVQLRAAGRSPVASAREPDTPAGRARAAVRALLKAAESLEPDLRLGLHGVRRVDVGGNELVVVLLEATVGRAHVHLPGTSLLDRSIEEAAALAALRALRNWRPAGR